MLSGDAALDSSRELTPEGRAALVVVEQELCKAFLKRLEPEKEIILLLLKTRDQPTAVVWQSGPML